MSVYFRLDLGQIKVNPLSLNKSYMWRRWDKDQQQCKLIMQFSRKASKSIIMAGNTLNVAHIPWYTASAQLRYPSPFPHQTDNPWMLSVETHSFLTGSVTGLISMSEMRFKRKVTGMCHCSLIKMILFWLKRKRNQICKWVDTITNCKVTRICVFSVHVTHQSPGL